MKPEDVKIPHWLHVDRCPGCDGKNISSVGKLPRQHYNFVGEIIPFPEGGINLATCDTCSLLFKTVLPTPDYLTAVFASKAGMTWNDNYSFNKEKELISRLLDNSAFDLLDIGPSNGALLRGFAAMSGRRAGLDVFMHPGLEKSLRGEFITGLLDQPSLEWSGEPYDVVTVFDVFEHLYNPLMAFKNLHELLKSGGTVMLETGNADSAWARRAGPENWRYTNLFEHHVFWKPESIRYHAERNGFKVVEMTDVDHKGWRGKTIAYKVKQYLKYGMWWLTPGLYRVIAERLREDGGIAPHIPRMRDHFLVVLRKL